MSDMFKVFNEVDGELTPGQILDLLKQADELANMFEYSYDQLLFKGLSRQAAQEELKQLRRAESIRDKLLSKANSRIHQAFENWKTERLVEYEQALLEVEKRSDELFRLSTGDPGQDNKNPAYISLKRQQDTLMIHIDVKFYVLQRERKQQPQQKVS